MSGQNNNFPWESANQGPSGTRSSARTRDGRRPDHHGQEEERTAAQPATGSNHPAAEMVIDLTQPHPPTSTVPRSAGTTVTSQPAPAGFLSALLPSQPAPTSFLSALPPSQPVPAGFLSTLPPPQPQQNTIPAQIPTFDQLEVIDGYGHVRIRPPQSQPLPTSSASRHMWSAPEPINIEAVTAAIGRGETIPQELFNRYQMPGTDVTADSRRHDPAPFDVVDPQMLNEPWDPVLLAGGVGSGHVTARDVTGQHGPPTSLPEDIEAGIMTPTLPGTQPTGFNLQQPAHNQSTAPAQPAQLEAAAPPTAPHSITAHQPASRDNYQRLQLQLFELANQIPPEVRTQYDILLAIIDARPEMGNQPFAVRNSARIRIWLTQAQFFERQFVHTYNVPHAALFAANSRFDRTALSRQRQIFDVQLRFANGLPQELLDRPNEMRLRRAVLEMQLDTLRAWTRVWRSRLPAGHPLQQTNQVGQQPAQNTGQNQEGQQPAQSTGQDQGDNPDNLPQGELERIAAFGEFLES